MHKVLMVIGDAAEAHDTFYKPYYVSEWMRMLRQYAAKGE